MLALAVVVAVGLAHPGPRFVDFIGFSARARQLPEALVDPLYPIGYPVLLRLLKPLCGDVLLAGRALSTAGAVLLVALFQRRLGTVPAAAIAATAGWMTFGSTEGTDMLAAALTLGALTHSGWRAGALLGAALLVRYSAIAAVPVVLMTRDWRTWVAALVVTAPHWLIALFTGGSLLPDQQANIAIGAAGGPGMWSWHTVERLPMGIWLAVRDMEPLAWVGALGLLTGLRDPRGQPSSARRLLAFAVLHVVMLGIVFSRPRLALPATLALAAGCAWLLRWRWTPLLLLLPAGWNLSESLRSTPQEQSLRPILEATTTLEGTFLSTSPWFCTREQGWLVPAKNMRELGNPRTVTPDRVARWSIDHGIDYVVVDVGRIPASWPRLHPLMLGEAPAGLTVELQVGDWTVYRVDRR